MLKRRVLLCALAVMVAGMSACIFNPEKDPPNDDPPPPATKPLTEKNNVIFNIEVAYNARNIDYYNAALDDQFIFFFSSGDVGVGEIPESWDRSAELAATERLFNRNTAVNPCQYIQMDIKLEEGVVWSAIIDPPSAPGETWHTTTLYYEFRFEISPDTYLSLPESRADFTVRNAGTPEAPHWQLVEFRDRGAE